MMRSNKVRKKLSIKYLTEDGTPKLSSAYSSEGLVIVGFKAYCKQTYFLLKKNPPPPPNPKQK